MVLQRISTNQGRRDETPNLELARDLAGARDRAGIAEIAANLSNEKEGVRNDCIKVLYEIGTIDPELIAEYAPDFLRLLQDRNNRMVWGGMTALSASAPLQAGLLCQHFDEITRAIEAGSVITRDHGVRVLASLAASEEKCSQAAFAYLLETLQTCRPKDVPQFAEFALRRVNTKNGGEFVGVLEKRLTQLSAPQAKRVRKVIREAQRTEAKE
ncbi:MAG TPA: hypothetical protein VJ768_09435 [Anaerolineales bacterium]|nr:hypothetical protein [Anaerolineales bacterium]